MYLEIEKDGIDDVVEFSLWLVPKIQKYFVDIINDKKLIKINTYLNEHKAFYFNYNEKRQISAKNILIGSIYNLHVKEMQDLTIIEISSNVTIPNTSAKFIDIAKLINFGNLSLQGYPIFTETMQYFADNLTDYYTKFKEEESN